MCKPCNTICSSDEKQQTQRPILLCFHFLLLNSVHAVEEQLIADVSPPLHTFPQPLNSSLTSLNNQKPSNNQFSQDRQIHPCLQQDAATVVSVSTLLHASRHPRALTSWLCSHLELLAGQQTSHPRGGADEISITISHLHLSSSSTHTLHPQPLLLPPRSRLLRCLVTLAPVISPLPSWWRRGREREKERGCSPLPPCPQRPLACLPACLPLLLLSTAVAQHQTLTSWDLNPAREPQEEEPLCVKAPHLSLR